MARARKMGEIMLEAAHFGPDSGVPLLIVHGLFGSARNWGVIAKNLAKTRHVITVDMRNHGHSPRFDSQSYPDMATDLAEVIASAGGQADVMGHSMGGKAAMALALMQPQRVRRLIVVDIAPVAYGHTQNHLIDAMEGLDLTRLQSRRDADKALSARINDAALRAFLLQSLDIRATPPGWRLNLETLRRFMPEIVGFPEIEGRFDGPALFVTGATSDYVRPAYHDRINHLFPNAEYREIAGAGHWIHAEQPRAFLSVVAAFLEADIPTAG